MKTVFHITPQCLKKKFENFQGFNLDVNKGSFPNFAFIIKQIH